MENNKENSTHKRSPHSSKGYTDEQHQQWLNIMKEWDPHDILGVSQNPDLDELKKAYK